MVVFDKTVSCSWESQSWLLFPVVGAENGDSFGVILTGSMCQGVTAVITYELCDRMVLVHNNEGVLNSPP